MATPERTPDSGADLARIALRQQKEAARSRGNAPQKKFQRRSYRPTRGDGRDPLPLQGVIKQLVVDRGWERGAEGGGLVARWPAILGPRAEHWPVHKYDEETGTLTVRCTSDAWAKMLQLTAREIVAEVNKALGKDTLQEIVVRKATGSASRHGHVPDAAPADDSSPTRADRFSPTGSQPGTDYRAAREGLREKRIAAKTQSSAPPSPLLDPGFVLTEPEDAFVDAVAMREQLAAEAQRTTDPRARALARARRERAATTSSPAPPRASSVA